MKLKHMRTTKMHHVLGYNEHRDSVVWIKNHKSPIRQIEDKKLIEALCSIEIE